MSRSSALYQLQRADTELDAQNAQLAKINAKLANDPVVQKAQARHDEAQAAVAEARRAAKHFEAETQLLSAKIAEVEASLYGGQVTNPRELADFQADAEALKRQKSALETEQLTALEAQEAAEKREQAARAELDAAQLAWSDESRVLLEQKEALAKILAINEEARLAAVQSVRADDLAMYDSLRGRKRIAVALLDDGVCTGCGMAPSSSRIQAARRGGDIVTCSNCDRILYAEHAKAFSDGRSKEDEMISRW